MSEHSQPRWLGPAAIVAAVLISAVICALSYLENRSYRESVASRIQVDPLKGNLTDHWATFGALSPAEVHFKQNDDGVVEFEVLAKTPSWSHLSSGVRYTVGFLPQGWYEFAGEFQAETDDTKGIGAQLELGSGHWTFATKSDSQPVDRRKKFDIYFRPSDNEPGAEISCRFRTSGDNRVGRAFLRNVRIVKIAGEPPPMAVQFDLEKKEESRVGLPASPRYPSFRGAGVIVLFLVTIVGISWRLLE